MWHSFMGGEAFPVSKLPERHCWARPKGVPVSDDGYVPGGFVRYPNVNGDTSTAIVSGSGANQPYIDAKPETRGIER